MTVFTETRHPGEAIIHEANGNRSREAVTIPGAVDVNANQILGLLEPDTDAVAVGPATFVGTGNGVLTLATPAYSGTVKEGSYKATLVTDGANAGQFAVTRPDGTVDGYARVGVAYNKQVKFTIADGATDFVAGDEFTIPVTIGNPAGVGGYLPLDLTATNGVQNAAAMAIYPLAATDTDRKIAAITDDAVLNGNCLGWPAGITADQKAAAILQLREHGIKVR
jgi:hypothetical protein